LIVETAAETCATSIGIFIAPDDTNEFNLINLAIGQTFLSVNREIETKWKRAGEEALPQVGTPLSNN
jgi:hypothetical protein